METFFIKALQLILSLSILVVVHEFGHYLFARIFKIKVEKFYLFFDAGGFALFKYKPKKSDTEYGIGWLPLGGYVKIAGMMDESMDKEQLAQEPKPWEFRTKPAWQRLLVMIGGVLFNVILAIIIYSMIVLAWGDKYVPFERFDEGMEFSQVAKNAGFADGDIILTADGTPLKYRDDRTLYLSTYMKFAEAKQVVVDRNGQKVTIDMPDDFSSQLIASKEPAFNPIMFTVVDSVMAGSPAQQCGLQTGDSIVAVNGAQALTFMKFSNILADHKNADVKLDYYRNNELQSVSVRTDSLGKIGFYVRPTIKEENIVIDRYSFFSSFPAGIGLAKETLTGYVAQMKFVFTKEGAKGLSGFAGIGSMFSATWDWQAFWLMTAFLSIILAVMNILPIPLLDGGHVMFLLYEMITRRKPNEKFQEYAQYAGLILILALLIYANGNDIYRFLIK